MSRPDTDRVWFHFTTIKLAFNLPLRDRPLLLLAILLIIFGVQLITMGIIGELAIRNYYESQNKQTYVIMEVSGDMLILA